MDITPSFFPLLVAFDLDETLFTHWEADTKHEYMTESAVTSLSSSHDGIIADSKSKMVIRAIERTMVKAFFDRAYQIISSDIGKKLLAIKIITKGSYSSETIKSILDKFYSGGDGRFSKNKFEIECFNKYSLCDNYWTEGYSKLNQLDISKGLLIDKMFMQWKDELPGLEKRHVFIIDNELANVKGVWQMGFSGYHYPTTKYGSQSNKIFKNEAKKIFSELGDKISLIENRLAHLSALYTYKVDTQNFDPWQLNIRLDGDYMLID